MNTDVVTVETKEAGVFTLVGTVDGEEVFARCEDQEITCCPQLWECGHRLVSMDERFDFQGTTVRASLDSSLLATFLTLLRCCDTVSHALIDLPVEATVPESLDEV
jgi:hypothetical protein